MAAATKLAEDMGVIVAPGLQPLTARARLALNRVLRGLDSEERESLVLVGAAGRWDWHMVDGTGRIWHFNVSGQTSWNVISDDDERLVHRSADRLLEASA